MCEGGLGAVARTKFVRRSDGRREVSHQSELTSECYLRQARMMEPSPSRLPRSLPPGAAAASTPFTSSGQWWESALSHVGGGDCGMQDAALAEGALLQPASSAIGGDPPKDMQHHVKRDTVIFVSRPTTPFFMQEYWGGVGKRRLTAQNHPCYWLRSV